MNLIIADQTESDKAEQTKSFDVVKVKSLMPTYQSLRLFWKNCLNSKNPNSSPDEPLLA